MGQKVHPYSFRLGYIKTWSSRWFARKGDFANFLLEDKKVRDFIKKQLAQASVAKIEIERAAGRLRVIIHTARPGVIIGRRGADIDRLREDIQRMTNKEIYIDIKEVGNPSINAQLIADNIAFQLEKRVAFRRAMKKAVTTAMSSGAGGIKVSCAGRLGGAEIARTEGYKQGKIPLHTLRADIEYGFAEAFTTYGTIGIKVWVYYGEVLPEKDKTALNVPSEEKK
ncbi:MAG: 30S ribosomal protein S3 [Candidatus Omnitrophota bacterium]